MIIKNKDKFEQALKDMRVNIDINNEHELDIFCENLLLNKCEGYNLNYIDRGSSRVAYEIKNNEDTIIKIDMGIENISSKDLIASHSFQGEVEYAMHEMYGYKREDMFEIYAISNNKRVIFCEKLLKPNYINLFTYKLDFLENNFYDHANEYITCLSKHNEEAWEEIIADTLLEEYLEYFDGDFSDVHADNLGLAKDGTIKMLDAGYGDGHIEKKILEEFAEKGIPLTGAKDFYFSGLTSRERILSVIKDIAIENKYEERYCEICGDTLLEGQVDYCQTCFEEREHHNAWWDI